MNQLQYLNALKKQAKRMMRSFASFDKNGFARPYQLAKHNGRGRMEMTDVSREELVRACLMNLRHVHNTKEGREWIAWGLLSQLYNNPKQYKTLRLIRMLEHELQ